MTMARRTRSLSELPGHLRVPILRRKDTERTKERLAAGVAGMEELRSLRQQQQQLVGETVAKAEDRRSERRHGDKGGVDERNSSFRGQTTQPPRHPLSWSTCHGYSMDSILEEGDAAVSSLPLDYYQDNKNRYDINNNKENVMGPGLNKVPRTQISSSESSTPPRSPDPQPSFRNPSSPYQSPDHHQRLGSDIRTPSTQRSKEDDPNPLPRPNGHGASFQQKDLSGLHGDKSHSKSATPSRRRSVSEWNCHRPVSVSASPRQRSMSVDMGHSDIGSHHSSSPHSPLTRIGNDHKFSSLTAINVSANDLDNNSPRGKVTLRDVDRERLCQSTSQINNVGRLDLDSTTLNKRRGSLTWDSLLKSIGIQSSTSLTSLDQLETEESKDVTDSDEAFDLGEIQSDEKRRIFMNRKKGRSMSFTCGNSGPLYKPLTPLNACALQTGDEYQTGTLRRKHSSEINPHSSHGIHPILRRASIQCEAVLTNTSRVVNPIQDVDVNSFKSPGPLHAVMLQYQGYKSPPQANPFSTKNINSATSACNRVSSAQEESTTKCLPSERYRLPAKHHSPQSPQILSSPASHPRASDVGLIPKQTSSGEQDLLCDNIIQENTNTRSTIRGGKGESASWSETDVDNPPLVFTETDRNKHNNIDSSDLPVTRVPSQGLEKKHETCLGHESIDNCPIEQPQSFMPQKQKAFSMSSQFDSDSGNSDPRHMLTHSLPTTVDADTLNLVNREMEQDRENTEFLKHKTLPENRGSPKGYHIKASDQEYDMPQVENISKSHNDTKSRVNTDIKRKDINRVGKNAVTCFEEKDVSPDSHILNASHAELLPKYQRTKSKVKSLRFGSTEKKFNNRLVTSPLERSLHCSESQRRDELDTMEDSCGRPGKRSSIFSEASVMSDASSKTPSSSASVFSDVSMVSDEGYSTCESFSPEHKSIFSTRLNSVSEQAPLVFSEYSSFEDPKVRHTNQAKNVESGPGHNRVGNTFKVNNETFDNDCDSRRNVQNFPSKREISLECSTPVVYNASTQNQRSNLENNNYRRVLKQTTV